MTHGLASRFLASFSDIESRLRRLLDATKGVRFDALTDRAYEQGLIVGSQREALRRFGAHRNALVHGPYYNGVLWAEPLLQVVEEIERLRAQLLDPLGAISVLGNVEVRVFEPTDSLAEVLEQVRSFNYSQFPVYEVGVFAGLLTTNAISRWLAEAFLGGSPYDPNVTVACVLPFVEADERAILLDTTSTVSAVIDALSTPEGGGLPPVAVLLTSSASVDSMPSAIAVASDLHALYASLLLG